MPETPLTIEAIIDRAMADTIETLAFEEVLPGEPRPALPGDFPEPMAWATVMVLAPPVGPVSLILPASLADHIAESIHSRPAEELGQQSVLDALGEVANTLAGRLMAGRLPSDSSFRLDLPRFGRGLPPPSFSGIKSRVLVFRISRGVVYLAIPQSFWSL